MNFVNACLSAIWKNRFKCASVHHVSSASFLSPAPFLLVSGLDLPVIKKDVELWRREFLGRTHNIFYHHAVFPLSLETQGQLVWTGNDKIRQEKISPGFPSMSSALHDSNAWNRTDKEENIFLAKEFNPARQIFVHTIHVHSQE